VPAFVEDLWHIEQDCRIVSCFQIVVYSFDNSVFLFCDCLLRNQYSWLGINVCLSIIVENLWDKSFTNNINRIGNKLTGLYDSARSADFKSFYIIIISVIFYCIRKKSRLKIVLQNWLITFIPISDIFCQNLVMQIDDSANVMKS